MKLTIVKSLEEMKFVLKDPNAVGPDPAYWVFKGVSEKWQNMTVIPAGDYNGEFTKTFGHYHLNPVNDENYVVVSGKGVLILQKKHFENGKFVPETVGEVQVMRLEVGKAVKVSGDFGHALINVGDEPLITYDDRIEPHSPEDYEAVARLHGLAYYIVKEVGKVSVLPNPNYKNLSAAILENSL
jgi:oxalate decarboxylase/phosphoglucose isomerase-like protein (cupin superfamily)